MSRANANEKQAKAAIPSESCRSSCAAAVLHQCLSSPAPSASHAGLSVSLTPCMRLELWVSAMVPSAGKLTLSLRSAQGCLLRSLCIPVTCLHPTELRSLATSLLIHPCASCQHSTAELPANDAIVLRVQHGRHFKLNRCDSKTTRSIIFYLINLKLSLSSYLIARRYHAGEVEHILGMLPYLIFFRAVITLKITLRVYFNN